MLAARWRERAARGPRRSREGPVVAARGGPRGGGGRGGLHGRGLAGWLACGLELLGLARAWSLTRSLTRGRIGEVDLITREPLGPVGPRAGHRRATLAARARHVVAERHSGLRYARAHLGQRQRGAPRTSASRAAGAAVSAFAPSASLESARQVPRAPRASGLAGSPLASQSPWARHQGHVGEGHGGAHQGERDGRPPGPPPCPPRPPQPPAPPPPPPGPALWAAHWFAPPPPPPPCPGPPGPPAWPAGAP
jgi:hypothetical protein